LTDYSRKLESSGLLVLADDMVKDAGNTSPFVVLDSSKGCRQDTNSIECFAACLLCLLAL
jgi:hypothetical protein